jgi:anti-anti-sigma factor
VSSVPGPAADAPGTVVVATPPEFDAHTSVEVRSQISAVFDRPDVRVLVLDMTSTHFVDSTGLGTLVIARNLSMASDRRLVLRGMRPEAQSVLVRSGMAEIFDREDPSA